MSRVVLINGPPGSGKSTLAAALVQDMAMGLALDIDQLKHSLGRWDADATASGLHARRLSLALVREQLAAGYDVVVGQYLARPTFIEELEQTAIAQGASFVETVLVVDAPTLAVRLAERSTEPSRHEHLVNSILVGPDDALHLAQSLEWLRVARPAALWIDASGPLPHTLGLLRTALA